MLPEAVFFDMDDTLLFVSVTASLLERSLRCILKKPQPYRTEELLNQLNIVRDWYWSDLERHRLGRLDLHAPGLPSSGWL